MPSRWNFHASALKFMATESASLQRLKDSPTGPTDRTIIDATVKLTPPIEMLNDEKERHRYATVSSILMTWCLPPDGEPQERDRLVMGTFDFRIRKVKKWPSGTLTPAYYELHVEDED
jgi:hypothetical protein